MSEGTKRNISVVKDADGNKIVVINDIIFKGKKIAWDDVEKYLRKYGGEVGSIAEEKEIGFIGTKLTGEYTGSVYPNKLKRMNSNAVQILPEMVEIASNGVFEHNRKAKHARDAKMGWYRYDTRFALPVYNDHGEVDRYNIFTGRLLIRHASSGKKYLYDVLEIKKESSKSCQA